MNPDEFYPLSNEQMVRMYKREKIDALMKAKFIAITTTLKGDGKMQKLYDNSSIGISTTVDFEYEVRYGK